MPAGARLTFLRGSGARRRILLRDSRLSAPQTLGLKSLELVDAQGEICWAYRRGPSAYISYPGSAPPAIRIPSAMIHWPQAKPIATAGMRM